MAFLKEFKNMFWGVTLDGGKRYTQTVEGAFHISMAALEPIASKEAHTKKPSTVSVMIQHEKAEFLLCTLEHGHMYQQVLDLNFTEGEEVTFFLNGNGIVHLTGYLLDSTEGVAVNSCSDDVESDESDSDEQDLCINTGSKKRKKEQKNTLLKKQKFEKSNKDESDDDESDEDDEDDISEILKQVEEDETDSEDISDDDDDDEEEEEDDDKTSGKKLNMKANKSQLKELEDGDSDSEDDSEEEEEETPITPKKGKMITPVRVHSEKKSTLNVSKQSLKSRRSAAAKKSLDGYNKTRGSMTYTPKSNQLATNELSSVKKEQNKPKQSLKQQVSTPQERSQKKLYGRLIVEDLVPGKGPEAKPGKMLHVYYSGKLAKTGKQFDSVLNGKPFKFCLGKDQVIKGWDDGLQGMKVGGKRRLLVPAKQGYGEQQHGLIPPYSALVFDVELKAIS